MKKAGGHRFVHGLARLQPRCRECSQGRPVPRLITTDDLVFTRRASQPVILPRHLDRRLDDLGAAALKLDRREIAGGEVSKHIGQLHGHRVRAVHGRRKRHHVELGLDRVDDPPIVMPHRDHVNAGDRVKIALAVNIPVVNAIGTRHHDRLLREFGHLIAYEDLAEEFLFRRLGVFNDFR